MKNWKKLLLCISVSVAITTFIAMTVGIVRNYIFIHSLNLKYEYSIDEQIINNAYYEEYMAKHEHDYDEISMTYDEIVESAKKENILFSKKTLITEVRGMMLGIYQATTSPIMTLYLYALIVGINTGILIYQIFIRRATAKKITITSTIYFVIIFLLLNIDSLVSGEFYNIDVEDSFLAFFKTYVIIMVVLFVAKLIVDRNTAKKLNRELK